MQTLDFSFKHTLILIAIVYGVVFSAVLIVRNYRLKNAQFWLGVFLSVFSLSIVDTFLKVIDFQKVFPPIEWTYYRLLGLIPLTIWVYMSKMIKGQVKIKGFEKFLISIVSFELLFRIYAFVVAASGNEKLARFNDIVLDTWLETIIIGATLWTIFKIIMLINQHQSQLRNNYSSESRLTDLQWAKELLFVLTIVTFIWVLAVPINYFFGFFISIYWIWMAQALVVFYFGIKGHAQPEIFHSFSLAPSYQAQKEDDAGTTQEAFSAQVELIEKAMKEDRLFTKPKLNLQDMANHIGMSPRQLSAIVNQTYHCSFSDFINQHRVEEVKRRILNKDHHELTLLAIAYESGFNSKSSFNAMFKKFTGQTPRQYHTDA